MYRIPLAVMAALAALPLLVSPAHAWWRGSSWVGVAPAPYYYRPPAVYYVAPPAYYSPPAYYRWVPGHWHRW